MPTAVSASGGSAAPVDVLIVTAIRLEYEAVQKVRDGLVGEWEGRTSANGLPLAFASFERRTGRLLRVGVALAADMGAPAATNVALPLVEAHRPRCIAMAGVCAGRPGKTNLGDVIAADRLFFHDMGKQRPDGVEQDVTTYNLRADWKLAIGGMDFRERFRNEGWFKARPIPYAWQEAWALSKLAAGVAEPWNDLECASLCPQWEKVIEALWKSGAVVDGTLTITEAGRTRIGRELIKHRGRLPDLSPTGEALRFKVHVEPMGSGNKIVEDVEVWGYVSDYMRKALGLEMEAAALGLLAHTQRQYGLDALVMKSVMDFANDGRDDHFKGFAARASAECLLAFLREHMPADVTPGHDDLLTPGTAEPPPNPAPSQLLNARYQVIPWHERGRADLLAELDAWADDATRPASARLLHAEGGVGKTRLAIEWVRRRRARHDVAGFLVRQPPGDWFDRLCSLGPPVLVVLDYAESRTDLAGLLERVLAYAAQPGNKRRVRVLMLARNNGDWWAGLRRWNTELGAWLDAMPPRELGPVAVQRGDRDEVFREAALVFAAVRGRALEHRSPIALDDAQFERVLYLHMAALAAVEGRAYDAANLMDVVLDHEERFWTERGRSGGDGVAVALDVRAARRVMAAATLRGGLASEPFAAEVFRRVVGREADRTDRELLTLLHRIYLRSGDATWLPALEPDLLGEGMTARVAAPPQGTGEPAGQAWIDGVFPGDEGDTAALATGFTVLGRASAEAPNALRPWVEQMLVVGPFGMRALLAFAAAKITARRTAFSVLGQVLAGALQMRGDPTLALVLEQVGVPVQTVSLREVAVWVAQTLRSTRSQNSDQTLREQSRRAHDLGARLNALGRQQEALDATREAVELRRTLVQHNPDALLPGLAMSLNNLGAVLSNLGRWEEALDATREAVELRRTLALRNPDAFLPNLAMSLNNLGAMLSTLGRWEEALDATREAITLRRTLVEHNPNTFLPDLAMSLNNQGNLLSKLGKREAALEAACEAAKLRRTLVEHNPDAFLPDLAMSLNNLGTRLTDLGQREAAYEVIREATDYCRTLVERNSDAFLSDLASCLTNLGNTLRELGRLNEALKVTREATNHYSMLAKHNPDAFLPDLATSYNNLGVTLSALGLFEETLDAVREAVALRRTLAERNPDAFLPDLAMSLNNLGNALGQLRRQEDALEVAREAVALRRRLVARNLDAFLPDLAMSLSNLGITLCALGRQEEGVEVAREAVALRRTLAERTPDIFLPELARSYGALGAALAGSDPHAAAAAFLTGAEAIEPLRQQLPHVFDGLANALREGAVGALGLLGPDDSAGLRRRFAVLVGSEAPAVPTVAQAVRGAQPRQRKRASGGDRTDS